MGKNIGGLATGIAVAGAVGASLYMLNNNKKMISKRAMKKNLNKAVHNVSELIEDISSKLR